jgi:hypothetical protein
MRYGSSGELGISVAQGIRGLAELMAMIGTADGELPAPVRMVLMPLVDGINTLQPKIKALEAEVLSRHRADAGQPSARDDPRHRVRNGERTHISIPDISLFLRTRVCRMTPAELDTNISHPGLSRWFSERIRKLFEPVVLK